MTAVLVMLVPVVPLYLLDPRLSYTLVAVVSVEEGDLFFYVNRFWVDEWSGMPSLKHKLGQKDAREWFDKAVAWMAGHKPDDKELKRFRAEAGEMYDRLGEAAFREALGTKVSLSRGRRGGRLLQPAVGYRPPDAPRPRRYPIAPTRRGSGSWCWCSAPSAAGHIPSSRGTRPCCPFRTRSNGSSPAGSARC